MPQIYLWLIFGIYRQTFKYRVLRSTKTGCTRTNPYHFFDMSSLPEVFGGRAANDRTEDTEKLRVRAKSGFQSVG